MAQIVPIQLYKESDFSLGDLRVQPSLNRVSGRGQTVRLEPKIMKVLVVLWRAKGEVVARDDLIREVWESQAVTDDAITRCISRLRRLLVEEFPGDIEIETVQKTGYRLVHKSGAWEAAGMPREKPRANSALWVGLGLAALAWLGWAGIGGVPGSGPNSEGIRPFATMTGWERFPAFSPDGKSAAFAWRSSGGGDYDLYRVDTVGEGRLRLTSHPANDIRPAWSPDGARLAFARIDPANGACDILIMPAIGGAARKVAECRGRLVALDWARIGGALLYGFQEAPYAKAKLFRLDPDTAAVSEIALPDGYPLGVDDAAFSPDGRAIALTLSSTLGVEDIYLMPAEGGAAKRLTAKNLKVHGLAWLPDGSAVLASTNWLGAFGIWRVPVDGAEPARILNAASGIDNVAVSPEGDILVEQWSESANLFSYNLESGEGAALPINSTRFDWDARPWPAGNLIAFVSDRSGAAELWLFDRDGETLSRLTNFGGPWTHTPRFSPNGQAIAFASPDQGRFNIYLATRDGGQVTRLTENAGDNFAPWFSPDGASLYFGSDRSGQWQIWRYDFAAGVQTQVTTGGGRVPRVSPDGRALYYTRIDQAGIWREALGQQSPGPELVTDALQPVDWNNWEILDGALYYIRRPAPEQPELVRLDLASGQHLVLLQVPGLLHNSGLWVAPGGETAWLTLNGPAEVDLLLIPGRK